MKTTKIILSNSGFVCLIAGALMFVGCADKRGFDSKRIQTPLVLGDLKPQEEDPTQPSGSDENPLAGETNMDPQENPPVLDESEIREVVEDVEESRTDHVGTQIVYEENGEKKPISKEELASKKEQLTQEVLDTANLPADQRILKGLSLVPIQAGSQDSFAFELMGVVELEGKEDYFTVQLIAQKKEGRNQFSVNSKDFVWNSKRSDVMGEVNLTCKGAEENPCVLVAAALRFEKGDQKQTYIVNFQYQDNEFKIVKPSTPLVSFKQAQNGVTNPDQATEDEDQAKPDQAEPEEVKAEDGQEEGGDGADEQKDLNNEKPQAPKVKTPSARQAEEASMAKLQEQRPKAKKAMTPSARQAEEASMAKLQEQRPKARKAMTPSARQAEEASMAKLQEQKKQKQLLLKQRAEAESMKKMKEQKRKDDLQKFREADRQSLENLKSTTEQVSEAKKAMTPSARQAEAASMAKLQEQKKQKQLLLKQRAEAESMKKMKEQKRKDDLQKFREADRQSMENLKSAAERKRNAEAKSMKALKKYQADKKAQEDAKWKAKIDKILKDHQDDDFEAI